MTTSRFDLSLGQRLAIGFGVLLFIFIVLITFVFERQTRSSNAQRTFVEEIAPRTELTRGLQEEVLFLGIAVRSYLLTPDAARLRQYLEAKDTVRAGAQRLVAAQDAAPGNGKVFAPLVDRYLQVVERIVEGRSGDGLTAAQELELVEARQMLVAELRGMVAREREETAEALSAMTVTRSNVRQAILAASLLMIVCFVGLATATTRAISTPVRELVEVARSLGAGDWRPALALDGGDSAPAQARPKDEMRILGRAFGAAAAALERRAQRLRADGHVAAAAASTLDKRLLSERVLRAMVEHLHSELGVVYVRVHDADELAPVAQFALDGRLTTVRVGEGIPGQAAADGRLLAVRDIPRDSPFAVRLGFDRAPAKSVVAVPLRFGEAVHGVAVVGTLRNFDDESLAFLEAAGSLLGVGLQNALAHEEIERLLADLRESNQQLQAQSEELQAQNEEIQAQNEEIQSQNEELQAQTEELHAQHDEIHRRSRELEEHGAELQRQAVLLTEADERKNEFLGLLAHELRNPLAPMTVSLYILKQTPPGSERALRAQAVIERQVQHLSRLTDDLLDVTRISHGKIHITRQPLNLVEVVQSCLDDQQAAIAAKALALDLDLPAAALWVDGDRTRLCQVLNNLLNNATKFTDPGDRLALRLHVDGHEAVLEVGDSGIGIDQALLPRIFLPFTQGVTSLARANGGLGLGLALVKALVEMHGGTVEARSDGEGCGSRFTVRLPLRPAPSSADVLSAHAHGPVRAQRVLLVEDNRDVALSLKEALELQGHQVDIAYSGPEGLEKALAWAPDIVLCDIGLPGMDGYAVARAFRADERLGSAVLVAVSGYASDHDRIRAMEAGFDRHLAKPLTVEALADVLSDQNASRLQTNSQG